MKDWWEYICKGDIFIISMSGSILSALFGLVALIVKSVIK